MKRTNPNFLNGVPELLLLQQLSRKDQYGYELIKSIKLMSKDTLSFPEGSIYPVLHSLQAKGYLSNKKREFNGRLRTYYRLTKKGEKHLEKLRADWTSISEAVNGCLTYAPTH